MPKRLTGLTGVRNERAPDWLRCLVCRYALKGLPVSGVCPECGSPVMRSIPGGLLEGLDAAELQRIRSRLGFWAMALILILVVWPPLGLACPTLAWQGERWRMAHALLQAGAALFAGFAWLPLMRLRGRTADDSIRRAGVLTPVALWASVVPQIATVGLIVWAQHRVGFGGTRWLEWAMLSMVTAHALLLSNFFVAGTRYSLALTHAEHDDRAAHRWTMWLGCLGALAPAAAAALASPGVGWRIRGLGVSAEVIAGTQYGLIAGGGVLVGAASLVWAGAWSGIDRCAVKYIAASEEARLKQQLAGIA